MTGARRAAIALAVAAATFLAAPRARSQAAADSLLDRAAAAIAAGRSLRAAFEQTLTNPDIGETRTTRGEFAQRGASRFAFRFTAPAGDAIVADGAAIWVYLPSSARGQVLKLPVAQGAQLDLLAQLLTTPRTTYRVTVGADTTLGGRATGVFTLVPKAQNAPFTRARLWIDRADALVRQVEAVELSGLVRRVRFRDVQSDVDLPHDALTFTVPPNVKVLDAAGLMGNLKP